jgi:hypothetical protein
MQAQPETTNRETQKRQVARIVRISDLTSGEYVQQSGWLPNFVKTTTGVEASRVNIIGILTEISPTDIVPLIAVDQFSATLDDGSAKMQLRSFEPITFADTLQVGVPVLVIARPKKYSGELFLVPEIIRKLPDRKWLEVRKTVLDSRKPEASPHTIPTNQATKVEVAKAQPLQAIINTVRAVPTESAHDETSAEKPLENALDMINRLDLGEGVLVEDAISELKKTRPELDGKQRIMSLLLSGDVFEIKPGRIKVLK